jgi:hypothetical protein
VTNLQVKHLTNQYHKAIAQVAFFAGGFAAHTSDQRGQWSLGDTMVIL